MKNKYFLIFILSSTYLFGQITYPAPNYYGWTYYRTCDAPFTYAGSATYNSNTSTNLRATPFIPPQLLITKKGSANYTFNVYSNNCPNTPNPSFCNASSSTLELNNRWDNKYVEVSDMTKVLNVTNTSAGISGTSILTGGTYTPSADVTFFNSSYSNSTLHSNSTCRYFRLVNTSEFNVNIKFFALDNYSCHGVSSGSYGFMTKYLSTTNFISTDPKNWTTFSTDDYDGQPGAPSNMTTKTTRHAYIKHNGSTGVLSTAWFMNNLPHSSIWDSIYYVETFYRSIGSTGGYNYIQPSTNHKSGVNWSLIPTNCDFLIRYWYRLADDPATTSGVKQGFVDIKVLIGKSTFGNGTSCWGCTSNPFTVCKNSGEQCPTSYFIQNPSAAGNQYINLPFQQLYNSGFVSCSGNPYITNWNNVCFNATSAPRGFQDVTVTINYDNGSETYTTRYHIADTALAHNATNFKYGDGSISGSMGTQLDICQSDNSKNNITIENLFFNTVASSYYSSTGSNTDFTWGLRTGSKTGGYYVTGSSKTNYINYSSLPAGDYFLELFNPGASGSNTNNTLCQSIQYFFKVVIKPNAKPDIGIDKTFCQNDAPYTMIYTPTGGTFSTNIVTSFNTSSAVFTPSTAPLGQSIIYYQTTGTNGCINKDTAIYTVLSSPKPNIGNDLTMCSNAQSVSISPSISGGTFNSVTGLSGSIFTPSASNIGNNNIIYTTVLGSCTNKDTAIYTVNSNPKPTVGTQKVVNICHNTGSSYTIPVSPVGGTFKTLAGGTVTALTGATFNPQVSGVGSFPIVYEVNNSNGCFNYDTITINVLSNPKPSLSADVSTCSNAAPVATNPSPTGGTFNSVTGLSSSTFTPSTSNLGANTIIYTVVNGSCNHSDTMIITVNNNPKPSVGADQSLCQYTSSNYTIPNSPVGGTFKTYAGGTVPGLSGSIFNPTVAGVGTHPIVYEVNNSNGCFNYDTVIMTVNSNPKPSLGGSQSFCSASPNYTIPNTPTGGSFNSVTGLSGNVFSPSTAGVGSKTITYTINTGSCTNIDTIVMSVFSSPPPIVLSQDTIITCNNYGNINLVANVVSPAGVNWSGSGITSNQFNPSSVASNNTYMAIGTLSIGSCSRTDTVYIINKQGVNLSNYSGTTLCSNAPNYNLNSLVTISDKGGKHYSPLYPSRISQDSLLLTFISVGTNNLKYYKVESNGCSDTVDYTMTVISNPKPTVGTQKVVNICHNTGSSYTIPVSPVGGTFKTLAGGTVTALTGATFNPQVSGVGSFPIVYEVNNSNGCFNYDTITINVLSNPKPSLSADVATCSNAAPVATNPSPTGGTFNSVTGLSGSTFTPSTSNLGANTIIYTVANGSCNHSDTMIITVNNKPNSPGYIKLLDSVCTIQTASANNIILKSFFGITTQSGISENWLGNGQSGGVTNANALTPGMTYPFQFIQTYTTGCADTSIFRIKSNNGSNSVISFTKTYDTICHTDNVIDLSKYNLTVQGGVWTYSSMTSAIQNNSELSSTFLPLNTVVSVNYAADTNGCPVNKNLNLFRYKPNVNGGTDKNLCSNGNPEILVGIPSGGTWSIDTLGTYVTVFNPSTLSITQSNQAKSYNLYYRIDNAGCYAYDTAVYTIIKKPTATYVKNMDSVCISLSTLDMTNFYGLNPTNGIWTGNNLNNNILSLTASGIGTKTHKYIIQNTYGCTDTTTFTTRIDEIYSGGILDTADYKVCEAASPINLNQFKLQATNGTWSGTTVIDTLFYPTTSGIGIFNVKYSTNNKSCLVNLNKKLWVVAKPATPEVDGKTKYCLGNTYLVNVKNPDQTLTYKWTLDNNLSTGSFKTGTISSNMSINLVAYNALNCPSFTKTILLEIDEPEGNIISDKSSIINNEEVAFGIEAGRYINAYEWTFGDNTDKTTSPSPKHIFYNPSTSAEVTYNVNCIITSSTGCKKSLSKSIILSKRVNSGVIGNGFNISIYPNPFTESIVIDDSSFKNDEYAEIIELNGKLIIRERVTSNRNFLDLRPLSKGTYLLKYRDNIFKIEKL